MESLKEILERRRLSSDIKWATKTYIPALSQTSKKVCDPGIYQFHVLNDAALTRYLREFSKTSGISMVDLYVLAENILREIGYNRDTKTIRMIGIVVLKIMKRILHKIYLAESNLLEIRNKMGNNPVVFLPTHRSYADFILMAYLSYEYNVEIPAVVAGMDFHSMFFVSDLLRNCGALFMRRSFSDDKLYAAIFKLYVKTILKESPAPFEFFIEGTRSRSGKSLTPKLGLLKNVVELYKSGQVSDVTLVPISISYDRVMEDKLVAYEVLGKPKPKESTKGLFKSIYAMDNQYGNIYINLNETISLKEFFHSTENDLMDLAFAVIKRQQSNCVITCFNILATVIVHRMNESTTHPPSWLFSEIVSEVKYVKNLLKIFEATTSLVDSEEETEIKRLLMIHDKLLEINNDYLTLKLADDGAQMLQTHSDIIPNQVSLMMLQYYANPCLHFLINPAIVLVLIISRTCSNIDELYDLYRLLRTIWTDEFVFNKSNDRKDFQDTIRSLTASSIVKITINNQNTYFECDDRHAKFIIKSLHPFVLGYISVCQFFMENLNVAFEERMLINKLRDYINGKSSSANSGFAHIYSLSSNFIYNSLRSLSAAQIITCQRSKICTYVCNDEASLFSILTVLRELIPHIAQLELICKI